MSKGIPILSFERMGIPKGMVFQQPNMGILAIPIP